jgi:glycine cleavage system H lipoate-binding protein
MTVLLILATFIVFLTIDYLYSRKRSAQPVWQPTRAAAPRPQPMFVAGFLLPEKLRYHPGHTWALAEGPSQVRIGLDDFAARLVGKAAKIRLPQRGQWVRQGQKIWTIERDGTKAEMVSPIEGMVTEVNDAAAQDPQRTLGDPYGEGWLVAVQAPDAKTNFRNLLSGAVARRWMEEAAAVLRGKVPALAGAVAQDGGIAVKDLSAELPDADWTELTREFFLS